MKPQPPLIIQDFSPGVNNTASANILPKNVLAMALNMYSGVPHTKQGNMSSRFGLYPIRNIDDDMGVSIVTDGIRGLFRYNQGTLAVLGDFIYAAPDQGSFVNIGGAPFDWNFTSRARVRFEEYLGYVFASDGVTIKSWDRNVANNFGSTNLTSAPIGAIIKEFKGRLYITQNTTYPSRVYFSKLPNSSGGLDAWDTVNDYFDVTPNDGDKITAIEKVGNILYIFKRYSVHTWDGTSLIPLSNIGATNQEAVSNINGKLFFVGKQNKMVSAFMIAGGLPIEISYPMRNWFDNIIPSSVRLNLAENVNESEKGEICCFTDNEYVYFSIGSVNRRDLKDLYEETTGTNIVYNGNQFNNVILGYNHIQNSWNEFFIDRQFPQITGNPVGNRIKFATKLDTSSQQRIIVGGTSSGTLSTEAVANAIWYWNYDPNTDDINLLTAGGEDRVALPLGDYIVPIQIWIQTHEIFNSPFQNKLINKFAIQSSGNYGYISVYMRVDGKEWIELGGLTSNKTIFSPGIDCNTFELKLLGSKSGYTQYNGGEPFTLERIEIFDWSLENYET